MKTLFSKALIMIVAALLVASAFAQTSRSKDELIKEIATLSNTKKPEDLEKAYQAGKQFLARFGKDTDNTVKKVRDFVQKYQESAFYKAVDASNFAVAFPLGKEILAEKPDFTEVHLNLAYAGYLASGTTGGKVYAEDTIASAKKAAHLLEGGSTPKTFAPYHNKNEALAFMYFIDGSISFDKDKTGSAANIYKATLIESPVKSSSLPYYMIAAFYEDVYKKAAAELKAKEAAKASEGEIKGLTIRAGQAVDLMMDAYARTVTLAETEKHPNAGAWRGRLTEIYKFKMKTEDGLAGYITAANAKPLPDPGKF